MDVASFKINIERWDKLLLISSMLVYRIAIFIFDVLTQIYGIFNARVKEWNDQRKLDFEEIEHIKIRLSQKKIIWMHCASLGEYEQGAHVINEMKKLDNRFNFILSIFSPSASIVKQRKNNFDHIFYLPFDHKTKMDKLVKAISPSLFIGVKYEIWPNLFQALKNQHTPIYYISFYARPSFYFFRFPFKQFLTYISKIYALDQESHDTLKRFDIESIISGDTRVDTIIEKKQNTEVVKRCHALLKEKRVIVYGSIYKEDIPYIKNQLSRNEFIHVLVPHDVDKHNVDKIEKLIETKCKKWTSNDDINNDTRIILIDTIGLLFNLYQYAEAAYIGGGFNKGIHNTLEPACFSIPMSFGKKYQYFPEACRFVEEKIAMEVVNKSDFDEFINKLDDKVYVNSVKEKLELYFNQQKGFSSKIAKEIIKDIAYLN